MFDDLVERYDLVNAVLSLGLDRVWRRAAARTIDARAGERVLDLGCGTGKLGGRLAGRARVTGLDLSQQMLRRAKRLVPASMALVQGSAFGLPFRDRAFSGVVSGFVLRNLDDLPLALRELARVLHPGGRLALLDITGPRNPALRRLFDGYFGTVAPALGGAMGKREAYRYLVRSLAQLPPPPAVLSMLEAAGFTRTRARPLTGGVVTLFTAERAA
jgi:demethylmenaquinone methyltransferase/2-methoxy-6-polyprenyl-1,4-benzoquinol methylase